MPKNNQNPIEKCIFCEGTQGDNPLRNAVNDSKLWKAHQFHQFTPPQEEKKNCMCGGKIVNSKGVVHTPMHCVEISTPPQYEEWKKRWNEFLDQDSNWVEDDHASYLKTKVVESFISQLLKEEKEKARKEVIEKIQNNCPIIKDMANIDGEVYIMLDGKFPVGNFRILPDGLLTLDLQEPNK